MKLSRILSFLLVFVLICSSAVQAMNEMEPTVDIEATEPLDDVEELDLENGLNAYDNTCLPNDFFESKLRIDIFESEPNNAMGTANRTYSDYNVFGTIGYNGDIDYYVVTLSRGITNFWIECGTNGANYHYSVYDSSGALLGNTSQTNKLVKLSLSAGIYYIKVFGRDALGANYFNGGVSYMFRLKTLVNSASIMQGNTESESDCRIFYSGLSRNGYTSFTTPGWTYTNSSSSSIHQNRVTASQFLAAKAYTVAYYSGHGAKSYSVPTLNAVPSNSLNNYGTSSPFNVATLLGVSSSNWQTNCQWSKNDNIRVLVLASCSQLDSTIVQYYARIMKASGIMAIAGYHEPAPIQPTDNNVASSFVSYAQDGNSVWYSWQNANNNNGYQPWAVLVYQENGNQYYRLPGFPGNTYAAPSSSASVYRYASFLTNPGVVVTSARSEKLPLTISTTEGLPSTRVGVAIDREPVCSDLSLSDNEAPALAVLEDMLTESELENTICVKQSIVREMVDVDDGILEDTATTIGRVYTYHNTYNGIKISDSFISVCVDSSGINRVNNVWKPVSLANNTSSMIHANDMISETEAIAAARDEALSKYSVSDFVVYSKCLAYAPVSDGLHKLCYEIITSCGTYFIEVDTGGLLNCES